MIGSRSLWKTVDDVTELRVEFMLIALNGLISKVAEVFHKQNNRNTEMILFTPLVHGGNFQNYTSKSIAIY